MIDVESYDKKAGKGMRIRNGTPLSNYFDAREADSSAPGSEQYYLAVANLATECTVLRDEQGLTQDELARRMGTKQSVISRFENLDGRLPSYDFIARLSLSLGQTPGMTLSGDFMAVVPLEQQSLVRDLAAREGVSTRSFVESVLGWGLARYQAKETHVIAFANTADFRLPTPCPPESLKTPAAGRADEKSARISDFAEAV